MYLIAINIVLGFITSIKTILFQNKVEIYPLEKSWKQFNFSHYFHFEIRTTSYSIFLTLIYKHIKYNMFMQQL